MSRADSEEAASGWIRQKLATLRSQAVEPGPWPVMADQLLALVAGQMPSPETDESDMEMFSLVLHDALMGVDISERYPAFWGRMMAAPSLYQTFIEALSLLETDGRDLSPPLPPTTINELAFLQKRPAPQPEIGQSTTGSWRVTWQVLFDQLQQLLFPTPDLVYRRAASLLEDESIILLHDEVTIADQPVEAMLEAVRPVEQPELLHLQLLVAAETPLPPLQASLHWGSYAHTAVLDAYGRAHFPPLRLDDILDEAGQLRTADLRLVLETPQS
ncbi:MAG: hypothetical protein HND44_24600 [Chloroflexi bacterium]|nr:hypothetical protein [Ardenticatenaceae bacterium]MBL1131601.1 hypothetical protein [Chloroflexota bacterium]NOG37715.1 hypothetical protein [Chloroflexota bacterium]GIK57938.1 MAG: hypothetical protein BroJett015_36010 [Chloroflexota bacterium]